MAAVATNPQANAQMVLAKAATNAAKGLGLTMEELGQVIGRDRTSIVRGLDAKSKPGELALLLIRCYRALYVLVGGNEAEMRHWFTTPNRHLNGIPKEQVKHIPGLINVMEYLDAFRGKI